MGGAEGTGPFSEGSDRFQTGHGDDDPTKDGPKVFMTFVSVFDIFFLHKLHDHAK